MKRYQAVVVAAVVVVTVAGCAGVPTGGSPSAGTSPSAAPAATRAASAPRATPKPTRSPIPSATGKPAAKATPRRTTYVIKAGDTLYAIAIRFKVTVQAILAANPEITNPNQIAIGQKIVIPKP